MIFQSYSTLSVRALPRKKIMRGGRFYFVRALAHNIHPARTESLARMRTHVYYNELAL